VAGNIALSAIVGYGLAKGKGVGFYLLASLLHAALLYVSILTAKGTITNNQMDIIIAAAVAVLTLIVLLIRWRKRDEDTPYLPGSPPVEPPKPETPAPDQPTMV
jgi:lipopolysaccharide export LptBFGC system permease protein LptF